MAVEGVVQSVTEEHVGSTLAAAAAVDDTTLTVVDIDEFDPEGGQLQVGTEVISYDPFDEALSGEADLTLATAVTTTHDEDEDVLVYPRHIERWCYLVENDTHVELTAVVPHHLAGRLGPGIREEDEAEVVLAEVVGGDLTVVDVLGREAVFIKGEIGPEDDVAYDLPRVVQIATNTSSTSANPVLTFDDPTVEGNAVFVLFVEEDPSIKITIPSGWRMLSDRFYSVLGGDTPRFTLLERLNTGSMTSVDLGSNLAGWLGAIIEVAGTPTPPSMRGLSDVGGIESTNSITHVWTPGTGMRKPGLALVFSYAFVNTGSAPGAFAVTTEYGDTLEYVEEGGDTEDIGSDGYRIAVHSAGTPARVFQQTRVDPPTNVKGCHAALIMVQGNPLTEPSSPALYAQDDSTIIASTGVESSSIPVPRPSARVFSVQDQTIANNDSTDLLFDVPRWDTAAMFDNADPERLTLPRPGVYLISGHIRWEGNSSGRRRIRMLLEGAGGSGGRYIAESSDMAHSSEMYQAVSTIWRVDDDEHYVWLEVFQNSGGDLDIQTEPSFNDARGIELAAIWIGD